MPTFISLITLTVLRIRALISLITTIALSGPTPSVRIPIHDGLSSFSSPLLKNDPEENMLTGTVLRIMTGVVPTIRADFGTPPQPIHLALNLNKNLTTVPAADCLLANTSYMCEGHRLYNKSLSTTLKWSFDPGYKYQKDIGSCIFAHFREVWDTVAFGDYAWNGIFLESGVIVPKGQTSYYAGHDGLLGLQPFDKAQRMLSPIFSHDRPLFAMKFPRSGETGELSIGDTNPDLYEGEIEMHPISESPSQPRWSFNLTSLGWESPEKSWRIDTPNCTADVRSDRSGLYLPESWIKNMVHASGVAAQAPGLPIYYFDCNKRSSMPNITIGIDDQILSLSPYEYGQQGFPGCANPRGLALPCMVRWMDWIIEPRPGLCAELGQDFLNAVYSVFDMEKREIGCEHRNKPLQTLCYASMLTDLQSRNSQK